MIELELFNLTGGLASVGILMGSLKVAMRAERGQREAVILADARERRNSVAVHLQKYSDLLTEVRDASKAAKLEIKNSAGEVLRNLCGLADDCAAPQQPRQSRHLFHEMSEQVFESFLPELPFQYEENILMRYAVVRRGLRELSNACKRPEPSSEAIGGIASVLLQWIRRRAVPSRCAPEQRLLSSNEFFETYSDLDSRLDSPSARRLLLASIDHIEKFCETQSRLRLVLESSRDRLAAALDRNLAEEFKVGESPDLWSRIEGEMKALGLMARLDLGGIKHFRDHDALDALPEFVYSGAVLYTILMVADRSKYSSEPMKY